MVDSTCYFVIVFFSEFIRLESGLPIVSPVIRKSLRFEPEVHLKEEA
jgi:hypothetical protein